MNDIKVGSTCSGICGIELGFELAGGFRTVWFIEKEPYPRAVIKKHWPNTPIYEDMRTIDYKAVEPVDVFIGGIPCQPYSLAGRRKGSQDERNLKDEFFRAVKVLKPKVAVIENVPGILSIEKGKFIGQILDEFSDLGYRAEIHRVSARMLGARHLRKRVFILAYSHNAGQQDRSQQFGWEQAQEGEGERSFGGCSVGIDNLAHSVQSGFQASGTEQQTTRASRSCEDVSNSAGERCCSGSIIGGKVSEEARRSELDKRSPAPGEALADSSSDGFKKRCEDALRLIRSSQARWVQQFEGGSPQENMEYSKCLGLQEQGQSEQSLYSAQNSDGQANRLDDAGWWAVEPDVGRVAYGVPNRVDRIKCLGNAVVPQVAQYIAEIIKIRLQEMEQ